MDSRIRGAKDSSDRSLEAQDPRKNSRLGPIFWINVCPMKKIFFIFSLLLFSLTSVVRALEVPSLRGYVNDNAGMIVVVAKQERKIRIEVGRGLEGRLTDLLAGRIIDLVITPRFKRGDFDGGVRGGGFCPIEAPR